MTRPYTDEDFRRALAADLALWESAPNGVPTATASVTVILDAAAHSIAARAWEEGHRTPQRRGPDDCMCAAHSWGECACGEYGNGELISLADNPYRGES